MMSVAPKCFTALIAVIMLSACQPKSTTHQQPLAVSTPNPLQQFSWLGGTWAGKMQGADVAEKWNTDSTGSYAAISYAIIKGDTIQGETIKLISSNNDIYYVPTLKNQNNGQPVYFKLTGTAGNEFVFENAAHDFPQRIIYKHPHADTLIVVIDGQLDGKFQQQDFVMWKAQGEAD